MEVWYICAKTFSPAGESQSGNNGEISTLKETCMGVPQGTICGPLLWLMYMYVDDLQPPKPTWLVLYNIPTAQHAFVKLEKDNSVKCYQKLMNITLMENRCQKTVDFSVNWCHSNIFECNKNKTSNLTISWKLEITNHFYIRTKMLETVETSKF